MQMREKSPGESRAEALLPLSDLVFHMLLALGEGAAHGYAIGKKIEKRTRGRLNPTTDTLYESLNRLHSEGLIEPDDSVIHISEDARRRYFCLTELGRQAKSLEVQRLHELVRVAQERKLYADH